MTRAAVFDVDGTLVDSNYLHTAAWTEAFRQTGHPVTGRDVHRALGLPGHDLLARLLGEAHDPELADTLRAAHKTLYATHFERLRPLPGAAELLRAVADRGWRVVLATSADGEELQALRRAIDADDVITDTASADDVTEGKPAPEPVHHARSLAGDVPAEQTVFVGDSVWDMRAAARAGATPIGVTCGGLAAEELWAAGAAEVHAGPAALLDALAVSPFGR
ncbi:HAD family hydrolase [Streptomyces spiramenti]|uniref:HAD family hydrolase n=1 Tax=Streptomyces spiramenti TaxID=2720606 RepID=A0ABX1AI01_9ACTN|nr:HAD family hydrolase [Streptomyces spiramenti]NJP66779.1 HAD family hydrolase [Streptomyces spiramenti]